MDCRPPPCSAPGGPASGTTVFLRDRSKKIGKVLALLRLSKVKGGLLVEAGSAGPSDGEVGSRLDKCANDLHVPIDHGEHHSTQAILCGVVEVRVVHQEAPDD